MVFWAGYNFSQFRSDLPPFAFTDAVVNQAQGQFADSTFYLGNLITSIKYLLTIAVCVKVGAGSPNMVGTMHRPWVIAHSFDDASGQLIRGRDPGMLGRS